MTKTGVIYILTNPSFPDYVKIGYAKNIEERLKQLNRSETIPYAFRVYAVYEVNSALTDKELHKLIDKLNPDLRTIDNFNGKERVKEFYAMSAEDAYELLESIAKISGTRDRLKRLTPEGHEILDEKLADDVRENRRLGPFRFSKCNIKPGEEVAFIENPDIKAVVLDDRKILYEGETTSLSALAIKLKNSPHALAGPTMFTYKGERLCDLRRRLSRRNT